MCGHPHGMTRPEHMCSSWRRLGSLREGGIVPLKSLLLMFSTVREAGSVHLAGRLPARLFCGREVAAAGKRMQLWLSEH